MKSSNALPVTDGPGHTSLNDPEMGIKDLKIFRENSMPSTRACTSFAPSAALLKELKLMSGMSRGSLETSWTVPALFRLWALRVIHDQWFESAVPLTE